MNKDLGLHIRIQRDLRDRFLAACRTQDKPVAQVVRESIRDYVIRYEDGQDSAGEQNGHKPKGLSHDH